MHVYHLTNIVLIVALSKLAIVINANAAELRIYQLAGNQPRLFHFTGGLADYDVSAQLTGCFDVEIDGSGAAVLTRFDLRLIDIVSEGSTDPGWSDGQSLVQALFENPVGSDRYA